jgi:hypothetical protein
MLQHHPIKNPVCEEKTMSILLNKTSRLSASCALILSAAAAQANPVVGALGEWKPIIDARVRYESVEQVGLAEEAEAGTARLRLGAETGKAWNTSLLVEGEFVTPFISDYADTIHPKPGYPVVADPESYELNRAHLTNTSINNTTITLGRQRINIDDQRFVGAVGWRQNEQTFDALRVVNKSVTNLTIDAAYFNRVNRIFSHGSPQGVYEGNSFLANVAYQTKIGKITAFNYLIDIENIPGVAAAVRDSNNTIGLRFAGEKPIGKVKLGYVASYATQKEYADNPLDFDLDYMLGEATLTFRQFSFGLGYEELDGNGTKGFTTPLATLHKFQGWADKFLGTPADGLEDVYASFVFTMKGVGPFDTIAATAMYHDFTKPAGVTVSTGADEIDLQVMAKWQRLTTILKYADYNADGLFTDTEKLWLEFGFVW